MAGWLLPALLLAAVSDLELRSPTGTETPDSVSDSAGGPSIPISSPSAVPVELRRPDRISTGNAHGLNARPLPLAFPVAVIEGTAEPLEAATLDSATPLFRDAEEGGGGVKARFARAIYAGTLRDRDSRWWKSVLLNW